MSHWKGIVGRQFSPDEFKSYVDSLPRGFSPTSIVLHDTGALTIAEWHAIPGLMRLRALEEYMQYTEHKSAGAHLFVADDGVWIFTPLDTTGEHSPTWDNTSYGVVLVGDYSIEASDSGSGASVREAAVSALATLCQYASINSGAIKTHSEDPLNVGAPCPGHNINKFDYIARVHDELVARRKATE